MLYCICMHDSDRVLIKTIHVPYDKKTCTIPNIVVWFICLLATLAALQHEALTSKLGLRTPIMANWQKCSWPAKLVGSFIILIFIILLLSGKITRKLA